MKQLELDWTREAEVFGPNVQDFPPLPEDVEEQELEEQQESASRAHRLPELIRPYQGLEGAAGHLQRTGRAMTTLPPGLGKTEAAILACLDPRPPFPYTRPQHGPVLIVCPDFLKDLWFDRITDYLPEASVVMASGTRNSREKALKLRADWYIINYEMLVPRPAKDYRKLARDPNHPLHKYVDEDGKLDEYKLADLLERSPGAFKELVRLSPYSLPRPGTVIFDESHHLASHESNTAQQAARLVKDPSIDVYMLTGTPIRREPDDLYMQMHILYPHANYGRTPQTQPLSFSVYEDFKRHYCVNVHTPWGDRVVGRRTARIQQLMDAVSYYCSYKDAGIYLPDVQHIPIRFELDAKHKDAYKQISQHFFYQDIKMYSSIEVMHALRAVTFCPPKLDNALNLEEQYEDQGILFYTWYISSTQHLSDALSKRLGRPIPYIDSTVPKEERLRILDRRPKVLVATLGTLSEGKDLSYMAAVCYAEGDWTPYKMTQSLDRVQRSGSTQTKVRAYYLLAKETLDETIYAVARKRGATADSIIRRERVKYNNTTGSN